MRAPGEPQAVFAAESHMDCIAQRLGMDPLEFRLKNLIQDGDENPIGTRYSGIRSRETLEAAVSASGARTPQAPNVGRGIARGDRPAGGGESHASVTLGPDGSIVVHTSIFEPGTGTYTILQKIVGEELHAPLDNIQVRGWDTDGVPVDTGVGGRRVTRAAGLAAAAAARSASARITAGSLPPNSSTVFFMLAPAAAATASPARLLPVSVTALMRGSRMTASTAGTSTTSVRKTFAG